MNDKISTYFAAPPEAAEKAYSLGAPVALMAYKTGQGFHLYRSRLPDIRPSLIYIDCSQFTGRGPQKLLCGEMLGECIARGARGIVLDIPSFTPPVISFCEYLSHAAKINGLSVYLPYVQGIYIRDASFLVSSDVARGSLKARLRSAIEEFGAENVALLIEHAFLEHRMPYLSGGAIEAKNITAYPAPQTFFSDELCVNYFSRRRSDGVHITLYDDSASILKKLGLALSLGVQTAFLYFPQIEDIFEELSSGIGSM